MEVTSSRATPTVAVLGAGLVGCLQACFLARRGMKVYLFERRPDIRKMDHVPGRSINMALSCRGRAALDAIGLEAQVLAQAIPMYARMIHDLDGKRRPIPYGTCDQYLLSIDRRRLNEILLTAAEAYENVSVFCEHRLTAIDLDTCELRFGGKNDEEAAKVYRVDAIFGCDGAYSVVRQEMQCKMRLNFSQHYITHGYMEVPMPPKTTGSGGKEFAMETNYLHIWARKEFMMIGLPNSDCSFTGTLFMPFDMFGELKSGDDVLCFFRRNFPDSLPIIGEDNLVKAVAASSAQPLITVSCQPFHYKNKAVLLGDAAHAMVPFYGQGMNCGFEDCLILDQLLTEHGDDLAAAFEAFSAYRCVDAHAISELAMANYVEMRAHVNDWSYLLRKKLDTFLYGLFPSAWLPLYTSVSFTRTRYHQCQANKAWQDKVVSGFLKLAGSVGLAAGAVALWRSGVAAKLGAELPGYVKAVAGSLGAKR